MEITLRYQPSFSLAVVTLEPNEEIKVEPGGYGQSLGWHGTRHSGYWRFVWGSQTHGCRGKLFPEHLESSCRRW